MKHSPPINNPVWAQLGRALSLKCGSQPHYEWHFCCVSSCHGWKNTLTLVGAWTFALAANGLLLAQSSFDRDLWVNRSLHGCLWYSKPAHFQIAHLPSVLQPSSGYPIWLWTNSNCISYWLCYLSLECFFARKQTSPLPFICTPWCYIHTSLHLFWIKCKHRYRYYKAICCSQCLCVAFTDTV